MYWLEKLAMKSRKERSKNALMRERSDKPVISKRPAEHDFTKSLLKYDQALAIVNVLGRDESHQSFDHLMKFLKSDIIRPLILDEAKVNHKEESIEFLLAYENYILNPNKEDYEKIMQEFILENSVQRFLDKDSFDMAKIEKSKINIPKDVKKPCESVATNFDIDKSKTVLSRAADEVKKMFAYDVISGDLMWRADNKYPNLSKKIIELKAEFMAANKQKQSPMGFFSKLKLSVENLFHKTAHDKDDSKIKIKK